jgi:hypothetical protein
VCCGGVVELPVFGGGECEPANEFPVCFLRIIACSSLIRSNGFGRVQTFGEP